MIHELGHDDFLLLKHERKSGPEEFPWLHRQTATYIENVVELEKKGKQCGVARGDPP